MIDVKNLSFSYGKRKVLQDINFHIEQGQKVAILGPNGVGKSTLFKCLLGLEHQYGGEITIEGENLKKLSCKALAKKIAYIPQSHPLTFDYSVMDMVVMGTAHQFPWFASPNKEAYEAGILALEQLKMVSFKNRIFNQLSGGEKQMVLIARALAQKASILVLDEPTSNLDYGNQVLVLNQVETLSREGYTIILSTHNPQHAMKYADVVIALSDQRIVAIGEPKVVINAALLKELYKTDVVIHWIGDDAMFLPKKDDQENDVFVEAQNG
ncbi:MAG: ABC transporter ATP-binding protein [Clostridia bacterium]|nr:ABC transporter ATP-binding protein [Clostridia bacterium]